MGNLQISIPDSVRDWIEAQVAAGRYSSASDYINALIREDQQPRGLTQLALIDGEESGTNERSVHTIADQARRRLSSEADLHISRERLPGRKIDL